MTASQALDGLQVVEYSPGVSLVGAGLASRLPSAFFRDFGARITRVAPTERLPLDAGVEWHRPWDRGKEVVAADRDSAPSVVQSLASDADVIFLTGSETQIEQRGLDYLSLQRLNPRLVVARIRPSHDGRGAIPDLELLVHARMGLLTQFRGRSEGPHSRGPHFCTLPIGSIGAAVSATVGALARLYERETTGIGGWAETSLYDGVLGLLGLIIGRVEHPSTATERLWNMMGAGPAMAYRCADGKYVQIWFGTDRSYQEFLTFIGDPPIELGYMKELQGGRIRERSERWATEFIQHDQAWWLERAAGAAFSCEPILRPGEILREPHIQRVGLSAAFDDPQFGPCIGVGPVGQIVPTTGVARDLGAKPHHPGRLPLAGVRVLDLSAYLAGPIAALVLGELGADVVKVEPATGDAHRSVEAMFAAGQRGKRAIALDLKAADAAKIMPRLFEWADVVHHNSRVGLADRLGYDEHTVRTANPGVVYCHASGFGAHGPRALLAANDHLMQALSGIEAEQGGRGQPPATFSDWGSVDVTGGWLAAAAILAALYARRRTSKAQSVSTSLLGAGMTMRSGAFWAADRLVEGPQIDSLQTGYGAAYRIYQCQDERCIALAIPDADAWKQLRTALGEDGLSVEPPALRGAAEEHQPDEIILEAAFARRPAAAWTELLRPLGVPVEVVVEPTRGEFTAGLFDDPVNRRLGRVITYPWGERGLLEQPGFPVRLGPGAAEANVAHIPTLGEHSHAILRSLGFDDSERLGFVASGSVAGPPEEWGS